MQEQEIKNLITTFHLEKDEQFIRRRLSEYAAGSLLFEELARAILERKKLPMHRVAHFLVMLVRLVGEPIPPAEEAVNLSGSEELQDPRTFIDQLVITAPVSEDIRLRVHRALMSFAKGIRNELQVFEQLTKQTQQGGAGMLASDANQIIQKLDAYIRRIGEGEVHRALEEGVLIDKQVTDVEIDHAGVPSAQPHRLFGHMPITQIQEFGKHVTQHNELLIQRAELAPLPPSIEHRALLKNNTSFEGSTVTGNKLDDVFEASIQTQTSTIPQSTPVSDDIARVVKKPQRTRASQQAVPKQIKQLVDQEVAHETVLPQKAVQPAIRPVQPQKQRRGFFSRLFSKSTDRVPQMYAPKQSSSASPQSTMQVRPTLDDVTYTPKLFSATDELASLTVEDFRRLSTDPTTAADKLRMKLEFLAQDSLLKRKDGISALQQSPLYKAYADILNISLTNGLSFKKAVAAQQTLTQEEFEAIMALNKTFQV